MTARTSLLSPPRRRGDLVPAEGPSAPAATAAPTTSDGWQRRRTAGPFQRVVLTAALGSGAFALWQVQASGAIGGPPWTMDALAGLLSGHGMVVFGVHLSIIVGAAAALGVLQPTHRAIVVVAALGCLFLGGLVGAMLWPASTTPITDIDGLPVSDAAAPPLSPLSLPERRGVS